jgi:hypothetical protein
MEYSTTINMPHIMAYVLRIFELSITIYQKLRMFHETKAPIGGIIPGRNRLGSHLRSSEPALGELLSGTRVKAC